MLYATGEDFTKEETYFWYTDIGKQIIWAGISLVVCLGVSLIDWKFWNTLAYPLYILGLIGLIFLLLFGTEIKGSKSWFIIAGLSLQPSELAKISTIIGLAAFCSSFKTNIKNNIDLVYALGLIGLPAGLVLLQPDAGSALTFGATSLILFRNGLSLRYFMIILALLLAIILSIIFSPYLAFSVILTLALFFILDFSKRNILSYLILAAFGLSIYASHKFGFVNVVTMIQSIVLLLLIQLNSPPSFWRAQYSTID